MMRNDAAGLCNLCMPCHPGMCRLIDLGLKTPALAQVATGLILDATLEVAGKLTAADVPKPTESSPQQMTLSAIFQNVARCSKIEDFLVPSDIVSELGTFAVLLDPRTANVNKLVSALQHLEEMKSEGRSDSIGPILRFIIEGNIGLKILAFADTVHKDRSAECELETIVSKCEELSEKCLSGGGFITQGGPNDVDPEVHLHFFTQWVGLQFFEAVGASCIKIHLGIAQGGGQKKIAQAMMTRIQDAETAVWTFLLESFHELAKETLEAFLFHTVIVIANGGLELNEAGRPNVFDLAAEEINIAWVPDLPLGSGVTQTLKVAERMKSMTAPRLEIFAMAKFVITRLCPDVGALYESAPSSQDIKRYTTGGGGGSAIKKRKRDKYEMHTNYVFCL